MFGQNPPLGPVKTAGDELLVREFFFTIQGEGPVAGYPAYFIRLAGCPLRCAFCDTDFSEEQSQSLPVEYLAQVAADALRFPIAKINRWVVLTGGEPFRHPVGKLVRALNNLGVSVQVETSGVMAPPDDCLDLFTAYQHAMMSPFASPRNIIVISPKVGALNLDVVDRAYAWKYVLTADEIAEEDGLPKYANQINSLPRSPMNRPARPVLSRLVEPLKVMPPVYVQPCDVQDAEQNEANLKAAADSAMRFGYRLGVQMHKLAGLR